MTYFIYTWDSDLQRFTPQEGVSAGPYTLFGLRAAIRELRKWFSDCSILVEEST